MPAQHNPADNSMLARIGLRLSDWFEKWFPDAFVLALAAVAVVFVACLLAGSSVLQTSQRFGAGFWDLVAFTIQMSMIVITGYAVATSPPVYGVIHRLAAIPRTGRGAAAYVALFSMLASLVSWSFSLIFSALLAREVAQRVKGSDYRAIGAAAYLGVGSVWALGLSSSAALIMAAPASLPDAIENISGVIPLGQTIGLWQSLAVAAALIVVSMCVSFFSAPSGGHARSMTDMGVAYSPATNDIGKRQTPGEWLEYSPLLTIVACVLGFGYLALEVRDKGAGVVLDLNHYVFLFLMVGMLLHWRPKSFVQAIAASVTPVGGVLIQYPMYAGIVRMLTESGLATADLGLLRLGFDAAHVPRDGRDLLRIPRAVHSVGGRQMAHRGAVPTRGRQVARCAPRLGGADLQRDRGARQSDPPILDVAARRHLGSQAARYRRLLDAAIRRARAARAAARLGFELHADGLIARVRRRAAGYG